MTSGNFKVVLDACALIPPSLCDLLLRLAEPPRLYRPQWTEAILDEVRSNQVLKIGFRQERADSWRHAVTTHFPEAMVTRFEPHEDGLSISPKDRHVLAAAIGAKPTSLSHSTFVTFLPKRWLPPTSRRCLQGPS